MLSSSWSSRTSVHVMALDSVVNVNSLFTVALFLGLSWADPRTSLAGSACSASASASEGLVSFHVLSFASFLFSTLVASALKTAVTWAHRRHVGPGCHVSTAALRLGTVLSGLGSVSGCGFLMMALVELVQIKLGALSCGSAYTYAAVVPLLVLVPLGLFVYVSLGLHAFTR